MNCVTGAQSWPPPFGHVLAALLGLLMAILLTRFGLELKDPAEAIFEGITMLLAAGILTWMIFWMNQRSRNMKAEFESSVQRASHERIAKWTGSRGICPFC